MRHRTARSKYTLATARAELKELGCTLYKTDGEYRVNFKNGREASSYYTDDLDDAVNTAKDMIKRLVEHAN